MSCNEGRPCGIFYCFKPLKNSSISIWLAHNKKFIFAWPSVKAIAKQFMLDELLSVFHSNSNICSYIQWRKEWKKKFQELESISTIYLEDITRWIQQWYIFISIIISSNFACWFHRALQWDNSWYSSSSSSSSFHQHQHVQWELIMAKADSLLKKPKWQLLNLFWKIYHINLWVPGSWAQVKGRNKNIIIVKMLTAM